MSPIFFHLLVEYPLYQSSAHLMVLLLLARVDQYVPLDTRDQQTASNCVRLMREMRVVVSLWAGYLYSSMLYGMRTLPQLTLSERADLSFFPRGLSLVESLTQYARYDFDRHTMELLDYNRSRNEQVHNDAGVYNNLISIARYKGYEKLAAGFAARARLSFPGDPRFY